MKGKTLLIVFILVAVATVGYRWLPSHYNPFTPLSLDDPPGPITQYKLRRLTPEACASLLSKANQKALIRTQPVADSAGACPLHNVVRVRDFGPVSLNSSFLASCPLALSSALFVSQQARPLTRTWTGSELVRIEHLGSYACRNIYHRPDARRSEHATAEALDISAFRLANGERVTILHGWRSTKTQPWLQALLTASCGYYGNGLGPEYNAAHANHFHLGMRGFGLCR
ncbi:MULTISPECIES: extensin-like domain-containing protein [Enterobacter cloacae complex]|uniref:extensin-like domain-containing protein n=1 Tax=Enterobacter cloacae complex TaxID=354276 RepID=UPI0003A83A28|nr:MULTISPECIES: extensin family protein [Enterobacter cloacae complex]KTI64142.1 extensin [Enterobacter cloacae subsp. cloacae]KVI53489.1 extensin [Enterobacter cloacae subsp. cloacae]MCM2485978.1 extensin family protein [Enterobacter cloacae]MCM7450875.1 extensin family protein [Enterobacter cloacae]MDD7872171.1 extensin family protein [Enterobacter cloacae complex sp. 2022EL-00981]